MTIRIHLLLSFLLSGFLALGHGSEERSSIEFKENKGQWHPNVRYRADLPGATFYLEEKGFTYSLFNPERFNEIHEVEHEYSPEKARKEIIHFHALKVKFLNAEENNANGSEPLSGYSNYIIGNNPSGWASRVMGYRHVRYSSLYPGIDLEVYTEENNAKYDFIVKPGSDYRQIRMQYDGADGIQIRKDGALIVKTSVFDFTELRPFAYQLINGEKKSVACDFRKDGNVISFKVGKYDQSQELVIDPVVVASTYSGSNQTTYGHSAAYDDLGNIITGGRCFGVGYPITPGAFDATFGGNVDIAITKLNPTGSARIYSTYIGGTSDEYVHSMFSLANNDLLIYGSCSSSDYPVTPGCYDATQNGSYDIIVTRLNSTGSALVGSTYIGGSGNDGQNAIPYNYGDTYRGEIIADALGTVYIASFTSSNNFPATAGVFDATANGAQDGVIIRLNPSFATLDWATYVGGSGDDAALGLKLDGSGFGLYIAGATSSVNFPTQGGAIHPAFLGGGMDGWVMYLASNGIFTLASSYIGTSGYDQAYFLQLDAANSVYLYGITEGNIPITPGCYGVNSGNIFIMKFPFNFGSVIYQTCLGSATASNFSPTAFLVDNCNKVYISGYGGVAGFATTPNAIPSSGSFYEAVIDQNATSLVFATYYGSPGDHVDGGTSRFDSRGMIYQGVCTGSNTFPTLPGSVATIKGAGASWDIAVFKIDMQLVDVTAAVTANPATSGCVPFTVNFTNQSVSGTTGMIYSWDFGDGATLDSTKNPSHTYTTPGVYDACMVVFDSLTCNLRDTICVQITVLAGPIDPFPQDTLLCPGTNITLDALNPGATYAWSTGAATQTINISTTGLYYVDISYTGCSRRDSINVNTLSSISIGPDLTVCDTATILLDPGVGGATYLWSTTATTQTINVTASGSYWVQVSSAGCQLRDTMVANVYAIPQVNLGSDTTLCPGNLLVLNAGNPGATFNWSNSTSAQTLNVSSAGTYWVQVENNICLSRDSIVVAYSQPLSSSNDTSLCLGQTFTIQATGTGTLLWSDGSSATSLVVSTTGTYWVESNDNGCVQRDTTIVTFAALPSVNFGADDVLCPGDTIVLNAFNTGASYTWNTGATTSQLEVTTAGTFIVQAMVGSCSSGDTIIITTEPELILMPDTNLCEPETISISTGLAGSYLWSTGSTLSAINVTQTGNYVLTLTTLNCVQRDTVVVNVQALPIVDFGNDTTLCPGASLLLDATNAGAVYAWQDGSTLPDFTVLSSGLYYADVSIGRCADVDSISVDFIPQLTSLPDSNLCEPETITLSAGINGSYNWSTGSTAASITVGQTGSYILTVTNSNCIQRDTIQINVSALPLVDFGGDTTLCPAEILVLDATNAGATYSWQDGSINPVFTINGAGTYWVNVSYGRCLSRDTLVVDYEPLLDLGPDTSICADLSFLLASPISGLSYVWSTGATTVAINITQDGNYALTVTTANCVQSDAVQLTVLEIPEVDLGPDTVLCEGENITLDAGNPGASYTWSQGSGGQTLFVTSTATYVVLVDDGFCVGSDTVKVTVAEFDNLQSTISICNEFEVILQAQKGGTNFLWSTGATTNAITVADTGIYWVETKIGRCSVRDTITVEGAPGYSQVYLPLAFTPNGDGKNDAFFGLGERLDVYSLRIYNRWGQEVFETNDASKGWDGKFDGQEAPSDLYVYKVNYLTPCSQNRTTEKMGTVMLMR
ncbi:MAG: gliding motility-associated C-terminal domain-containing protein [Bacteroidetes bacterium]|nr:gliding motility-associated C-terminal domain-containing protein [Bacteroidota bacterium]